MAIKDELKLKACTNIKGDEDKITAERDGLNLTFVCVGGGRIEHNIEGKLCSIYGYSQSYGKIDHRIAQHLISKNLGYELNKITLDEKDY